MDDVTRINQAEPVSRDKSAISSQDKKKQKKRRPFQQARRNLETLTRITDEVHRELEMKDSPFRICIYQEGEDVYIDIVTLDENGRVNQVFKHDISEAELENLVQQIKSGRGLIFDASA